MNAQQNLESGLIEAKNSGCPFFISIVSFGLANVLFNRGEIKETLIRLDEAIEISKNGQYLNQYFQHLIFYAYIEMFENNIDAATEYLKEGLRVGRESNYYYYAWWRNDVWEKLAPFALEKDIEADYVKEIIARHDISPKKSAYQIENWPWKYKVKGFGFCEVFKEDKKIGFGRKAPKKSIELVGALVAHGGKEVPDQKIIDALWPDAEGDAGHQDLATALHRLRKIFDSSAIQYREGRLSINPDSVWVDVWAFEDLISRLDKQSHDDYTGEDGQLAEKALALYRGHFLSEHSDANWAIPMREKLRNKFLRCVEKYGSILEKRGQYEKALYWYQRGLEIDVLAEQFYQRLMFCYDKMDRKSDAVETYRQCYRILTTNLEVEPSKKTKEIYTSIRA